MRDTPPQGTHRRRRPAIARIVAVPAAVLFLAATACGGEAPWRSPCRYRLLVKVDPLREGRSFSPVSLEVDLAASLRAMGGHRSSPFGEEGSGEVDETSIEVIGHDVLGAPYVFDASRDGYERHLLPWRLERLYGAAERTLHFVLPDERCVLFAVYLETAGGRRGRPPRYPGPVGDGDLFREAFGVRETAACHFDAFADLDRDGDLDLFRGGVEPFLLVLENVGRNRLIERGRLASGGKLLVLPHGGGNGRSWVVPHFHDLDRDGDLDLIPSFMDGPHARRLVLFENVTVPGGPLTFTDRGPLKTVSGVPIAGGEQEGGWFPSAAFVEDLDVEGDGRTDLIVGTKDRCYLYRNLGPGASGGWRWADATALRAGGEEIVLFNPCFAAADVDGDGDLDLFAAPQSGEVLLYRNEAGGTAGGRAPPRFAKGIVVACDEVYTMPSTHPRVTVADFTGDGLLDLAIDRAWELADLRLAGGARDFGALLANIGTAAAPRWSRVDAGRGAPNTEGFQICDALRQNVVRAADWDGDGRPDLLAGDCDGFVWWFRNTTDRRSPVFAPGIRLRAGGATLSLAGSGGHARPDVCDWNGDGRNDLVVADGAGGVTVFLDGARSGEPALEAGRKLEVQEEGKPPAPIRRGSRSHVIACDWNGDGRKDLVFSDQEHPGFFLFEGRAGGDAPFAPARPLGIGPSLRPNLGSFVDWDGDGRKDLIGCEFETTVRLYRNVGSAGPGEEPRFAGPEGEVILRPPTIMMISGADAVDWNGDGDLDILTGQGHGGSGLRYYERDFIEDELRGAHPRASVAGIERAPDLLAVVRGYADAMIEHGRDVYGPQKSGLFLSALDRSGPRPLAVRPAPPGGIRREDRAGLPWRALTGANPQLDENLLRVLHVLGAMTGDRRYGEAADGEARWFFENAGTPATGLLPWGEHLAWDVFLDRPISSGTDLTHEFSRPWALWERTFDLAPGGARRFALGLWEHQIANHQTGGFDRHAPIDRHGPADGKDFPRHGGFYIDTWAHAYARTKDAVFLRAIETILARFERKRSGGPGGPGATIGPLDTGAAAALVPEPLAGRLRTFAGEEDRLVLGELRRQHAGPDGKWRFRPTWQAGYSSGVTADWAMFAFARWEQVKRPDLAEVVLAVADAYRDELPAEDVDVWPMSLAHVISAEVYAWRLSGRPAYLEEACRYARLAVRAFWDGGPLPRASFKTGHYETITGADSLALALLEVHAAACGLDVAIPSNTIDR